MEGAMMVTLDDMARAAYSQWAKIWREYDCYGTPIPEVECFWSMAFTQAVAYMPPEQQKEWEL